jgi:pimeloyl-ACP methyl ester carboxylesterase
MMSASSVGNAMAYGMHNSVVCAEDIPRFDAKLDRKPLEATFMGTQQVELLQALCEGWPRGPVDADLYTPLKGELPVLLLSGSADPVTPPAQAKLAALQLPNAVQRVLPDQGHGQLLAPCMNTVMAEFLRLAAVAPAVRQLDVSCLEAVKPAPFMLGPSGPGP